jgi:oxepin-CoA hydrolase/3-oxo-5,6-dehydrosuberyl-CoA semialdehyde dehydrogenase
MSAEGPKPVPVAFDVNDEDLRGRFFGAIAMEALAALKPDSRPAWGNMSAQQVVEHLTWVFELSTGAARVTFDVPEEQRRWMKTFLSNAMQSPRGIMNPALASGLPALKVPNLPAALAGLDLARRRFLEMDESGRTLAFTHPLLGPLVHEEWSRFHFKHVFHHLLQFGLITVV